MHYLGRLYPLALRVRSAFVAFLALLTKVRIVQSRHRFVNVSRTVLQGGAVPPMQPGVRLRSRWRSKKQLYGLCTWYVRLC